MTSANYTRAIDLLRERFGKQNKITHAAMQALVKLPAPSSKVSSVRNFHDKMETSIRSLEAMGQNQENYGNLLVPVVLDKMPSEVRRQLARENGDTDWVLADLRRTINREIGILEAGTARSEPEVDDYEATASFLTGARSRKRPQQDSRPPAGGAIPRTAIKCLFCEGGHKARECTTYADTDSRLQVVKEKHLCFNCLGKHPVAKCSSSNRCQICVRKHHTTICNSRHAGNQNKSSSSNETTSSETAVLHPYTSLPDKGVLLKIAIATVSSADHVQTEANILFDEGAQKSFITELSRRGTEWRFIPKRAPWYGGFWERLIGLTKTSLKKILGRQFVTMETLQTIVSEIEAVMNDRPLTHVSSNIDDLEPLTPSNVFYGRKMTSLPYHQHYTDDEIMFVQSDQTTLTNRSRTQANIISWRSEYLTALREYHKTTGSNEESIRVGDVVQIHDEGPRIRWKLAVVQELMTGNDGSVHAAKVKTKNGFTMRPIVKLYPLETVTSDN